MAGGWKTGRARCFDKQIQAKQQTRRVLRPRSTRHRSFPLLHPSSQDFNSKSHPLSHIPSRSPHQNSAPSPSQERTQVGGGPLQVHLILLVSSNPSTFPVAPQKREAAGYHHYHAFMQAPNSESPCGPREKTQKKYRTACAPTPCPFLSSFARRPPLLPLALSLDGLSNSAFLLFPCPLWGSTPKRP